MRKKEFDRDFIVEKYNLGWSASKLAEHFGTCHTTIIVRLREWEIPIRPCGFYGKYCGRKKKNLDREFIIKKYSEGRTLKEISRMTSINAVTIWSRLREWGIPLRRRGAQGRPRPWNTGLLHKNWKGGRRADSRGYIRILAKEHPRADESGYVYEHILVLEKKLGRYLKSGEVSHHINGNRGDNRPENLMVFSGSGEHSRHHLKKYRAGADVENGMVGEEGVKFLRRRVA